MAHTDPRSYAPLPDAFLESAQGRQLVDQIAAARPWREGSRRLLWVYLCFLRRGLLSLHVIAYAAFAIRDPWLLLLLGLATVLFEWRLVPRALDQCLSDQAFARFVLSGRRFEPPGGTDQARRVRRTFLVLWLAGLVLLLPLWWTTWNVAQGTCADTQSFGVFCQYADEATSLFVSLFGLLTLGPVAYTSRRFPLLLPMRFPKDKDGAPALHRWAPPGHEGPSQIYPRPTLLYFFPLVTSSGFLLLAPAIGVLSPAFLNPLVLLAAFGMGGVMPLFWIVFQCEFKAWLIIRAYQQTDTAERRTAPFST